MEIETTMNMWYNINIYIHIFNQIIMCNLNVPVLNKIQVSQCLQSSKFAQDANEFSFVFTFIFGKNVGRSVTAIQ